MKYLILIIVFMANSVFASNEPVLSEQYVKKLTDHRDWLQKRGQSLDPSNNWTPNKTEQLYYSPSDVVKIEKMKPTLKKLDQEVIKLSKLMQRFEATGQKSLTLKTGRTYSAMDVSLKLQVFHDLQNDIAKAHNKNLATILRFRPSKAPKSFSYLKQPTGAISKTADAAESFLLKFFKSAVTK